MITPSRSCNRYQMQDLASQTEVQSLRLLKCMDSTDESRKALEMLGTTCHISVLNKSAKMVRRASYELMVRQCQSEALKQKGVLRELSDEEAGFSSSSDLPTTSTNSDYPCFYESPMVSYRPYYEDDHGPCHPRINNIETHHEDMCAHNWPKRWSTCS